MIGTWPETDTWLETKTAGTTVLLDRLPDGEGEDGIVYEAYKVIISNNEDELTLIYNLDGPEWLVKAWKPAGRLPDSPEWHEAEKRYQTFSALQLPGQELRCLPQEYVSGQDVPAYLSAVPRGEVCRQRGKM